MKNKEIWKDIPGYEDKYQVSNLGNVRSLNYRRENRIKNLSLCENKGGYLYVVLRKDNKNCHNLVHRLVGMTFLENNENKPSIDHIDGNKRNNTITNLRWCTHKENTIWSFELGLQTPMFGIKNGNAKLTENDVIQIKMLLKKNKSHSEIATKFNIHKGTVSKINCGTRWSHIKLGD